MQHDTVMDSERPKAKILFVDDEPRVLDGLRRILRSERNQWEMTFVEGVQQALEVLGECPQDAVVSDIDMPIQDGLELLQMIREDADLSDIPVVILSGNGESGMKRRALDLGATDLLAKPVEREDLVARVNSVLRLKRYTDEIKLHGQLLEERVRERTRELEFSRAELVWRLGKAGEFRDSDTGYHVVRVGYYARTLATTLGLDECMCREIFLSAPLHDIGKIGIPDSILLKPAKLTEEEWVIMKTHTTIGGQILRSDPLMDDHARMLESVAKIPGLAANPLALVGSSIAEGHHERWSGGGYPRGIEGEEIPLAARISSVADVYDALCSPRPYKPAFAEVEVLEIMRKGSGSQFDPQVFAAFEDSISEFRSIREQFKDEEASELQADTDDNLKDLI